MSQTSPSFQPLVLRTTQSHRLDLVLAIVGTVVIAYIVKAVVGLRPTPEVETSGLDLAEHGEEGYHATGAANQFLIAMLAADRGCGRHVRTN